MSKLGYKALVAAAEAKIRIISAADAIDMLGARRCRPCVVALKTAIGESARFQ